jgi:3-hydroxyacyl-CoA dehydrogenase/enoyl-CoA hydratase/carnithine racemase
MGMIEVERRPDGVAMVVLDHPTKAVNTLSPAAVEEFNQKVAPLLDDTSVRAMVVVSAKPDTFIAGADLELIEGLDAAEISAMSRDGNALLERIATSRKPVVAAVHGAALGGGFEVALACHYILATDDPKTVLAQSEVMLGLLPAGGGTQRLVERVGLVAALPMLLTGRRVRARRAKRMGLVDAITTPGGIAETGARAALALAEGSLRRTARKKSLMDRFAATAAGRAIVLRKARQQVARQTRGLYPAPPAILDCVETGLKKGRVAGLARESEYFGKLAVTPESRNLVRLFHAMNEAKKGTDGEARDVRRLAVLGGGFMGSGVASVSLGLCPVVVRDISSEVLGRAAKSIDNGLERQVRSGAIRRVEADRRRSRLRLTTEVDDLEGAELVVEAVFEDLDLKRRVLAEVEERISRETVFASNTSALPISAVAAGARHPERVIGMHYFSPVPKMPLLEIVVADQTATWATATARAFGIAQGKTCIVVKDGPGFYTTRILAPYLNEAVLLVEEGARVEDVDRAMKDFGYPVGPMALIDEVGIDVGAHVAQDLGRAFADRGLEGSGAMPRLYEAGLHGRKNGRGFYVYPQKKKKRKKKEVNPAVYELLGGDARRTVDAVEIQDRLALLMVNEAVHCLQDAVIASPRDGDLGAILGLGFPPFRGGPFRYVDATGRDTVRTRLEELASKHGKRFEPAALFREQGLFYP